MLHQDGKRLSPMGDKIPPKLPISTSAPMSRAEARACAGAIRSHLEGARVLILDLFERRGWEALGYKSWRECVVAEFDVSTQHLYRQLEAAKVERVVAPGQPIGSIPERSLRPLAGLPPETQAEAYAKAALDSPSGRPTASQVKAAVAEVAPRPTEPADIAAQRAAGIIPEGVEVLVEEPGEVAEQDVDEPADVMAEQSDEEYLAGCAVRARLSAACRKAFDRDALLFRLLTPHRKKFHHHARRLLNANRRAGRTGMYHAYVSMFLRNQHPQHWLLCGDCGGIGQVVTIGECPTCHGMGYRVR